MSEARCSSCGYTKEDAQVHMDHHLCKNAGNAPWERPRVRGGTYRPHYRKDEADRLFESYRRNYGSCLEREKVWLEIVDDLMVAIASDNRRKLSEAYNRAAMKIAAERTEAMSERITDEPSYRLKYLQPEQYQSWLRKVDDPEWSEHRYRTKQDLHMASAIRELRDAVIELLTLRARVQQLFEVADKMAKTLQIFDNCFNGYDRDNRSVFRASTDQPSQIKAALAAYEAIPPSAPERKEK